jgi:protein O-mannosyl-transferase
MKETRKLRRSHRAAPLIAREASSTLAVHPAWRRHAWRMLALWVLVLAAYSNSFKAGLVFDSAAVISEDARVHAVTTQNLRHILTEPYWRGSTTLGLYRPLTTFSYLLNYAVLGNGVDPAGYHWVNLALHGVNVSLVYVLGVLVLGAAASAFALAAVWGLHPLLTESVTNIVGRADLLAAFGVLAGLLCYIRSVTAAGRHKLFWVAAMVAAQAVGIFSKENGAVLPAIMLLYDLTWRNRAAWRACAPTYAALVLPFAAFFYLRGIFQVHLVVPFGDNPMMSAGFWAARLTAIKVIGKYLWLFIWPARLSPDYSYNAVPLFGWHPAQWEDSKALIALALCVSAVVLAVRWYRTSKPLFFFLAFFFVALVPTSNLAILIGSIMAERFVYLPSIGLAGCVVAAIWGLSRQVPPPRLLDMRAIWTAVALVCLACAARTYARNSDWLDDQSLWTSAENVVPGSARVHNNLGQALTHVPGRLPDAIAELQAALQINPNYAAAHSNLGSALAQMPGHLPDAITEFQAALRIDPDSAEAHYNLGNVLSQVPGRLPEAIAQYKAVLRLEPDDAAAHNNLGLALANSGGRWMEAVAEYEATLRANPNIAAAHLNLGNALFQLPGRLPDAITQYETVLRLEPGDAAAHLNLGNALSQLPGRLPDAIAQYEMALRIDPDYAMAHFNLGNALSQLPGRLPDAIAQYDAALRIEPLNATAHNNLGLALVNSGGRLQEAIDHFEAALRINPDLAEAHYNLGKILSQRPGRLPESIAHYEAALRIRPDPKLQELVNQLRAGRK